MKKSRKKPIDRTNAERQRRYRERLKAAAKTIYNEAHMTKPRDYPFRQVVNEVDRILRSNQNITFYQKFTCEKCGTRQGMMEENTFHKSGKCEECGHVTNIVKRGCNYMVVAKKMTPNELFNILKGEDGK